MIKLKSLLINLLIPLGGGWLVSFITQGNTEIYKNILLPKFAPPSLVFPIVWTILYFLMGISAYMVYESDSKIKSQALKVYALQLCLNFLWPLIFFNGQMFLASFIILLLLWLTVLWMIILFYKVKPLAAYLQIPYILWLTFAAYLNLAIYLLNR